MARRQTFDYPAGHVETLHEYLCRGGAVTRVTSAWSRHLTEEETLLAILHGGTDADTDRGFAWSDLVTDVRDRVRQVWTDEQQTAQSDDWEWA